MHSSCSATGFTVILLKRIEYSVNRNNIEKEPPGSFSSYVLLIIENGEMIMKNKQKKEDNFLLYIPQKKHIDWEEKKGKVYLIFHHDKMVEKFIRWLVKKPYVSDVELDDLGSSAWKFIDGKKSVYEIGQCMLMQYGKACEPVNERLIMFLRYLNKRGWTSFERGSQN